MADIVAALFLQSNDFQKTRADRKGPMQNHQRTNPGLKIKEGKLNFMIRQLLLGISVWLKHIWLIYSDVGTCPCVAQKDR